MAKRTRARIARGTERHSANAQGKHAHTPARGRASRSNETFELILSHFQGRAQLGPLCWVMIAEIFGAK